MNSIPANLRAALAQLFTNNLGRVMTLIVGSLLGWLTLRLSAIGWQLQPDAVQSLQGYFIAAGVGFFGAIIHAWQEGNAKNIQEVLNIGLGALGAELLKVDGLHGDKTQQAALMLSAVVSAHATQQDTSNGLRSPSTLPPVEAKSEK